MGEKIRHGDIDYSEIYADVVAERETKKALPREEKKRLAAERKVIRLANKEKYGYATIDGDRCELGNYMVEPSSIFMGRGEHPFRGKWKEGPRHGDVILNHSPDMAPPPGNWLRVDWDPDSIWVAKWKDKLTEKMKYVWPRPCPPPRHRPSRHQP